MPKSIPFERPQFSKALASIFLSDLGNVSFSNLTFLKALFLISCSPSLNSSSFKEVLFSNNERSTIFKLLNTNFLILYVANTSLPNLLTKSLTINSSTCISFIESLVIFSALDKSNFLSALELAIILAPIVWTLFSTNVSSVVILAKAFLANLFKLLGVTTFINLEFSKAFSPISTNWSLKIIWLIELFWKASSSILRTLVPNFNDFNEVKSLNTPFSTFSNWLDKTICSILELFKASLPI